MRLKLLKRVLQDNLNYRIKQATLDLVHPSPCNDSTYHHIMMIKKFQDEISMNLEHDICILHQNAYFIHTLCRKAKYPIIPMLTL